MKLSVVASFVCLLAQTTAFQQVSNPNPIPHHPEQPSGKASLFKGESVVLTGSTGFVGLRTLKTLLVHTDAETIILPVRVEEQTRTAAAARFASVLEKYGEGLDIDPSDPTLCFVPMKGGDKPRDDVYVEGISKAPAAIREKCSTILHVASETDWDIPVDVLIDTNLKPSLGLLKGATNVLPNVDSFLYCSTAYADSLTKIPERPVPEGPLAPISDSTNKYFSNYGQVKAMTEDAIHACACSDEIKISRVSIARPGAVAPSIGHDNAPLGWHTNNKSYAALLKLLSPSGIFGQMINPIPVQADIDTGIIPVDYVANMIVLAGGNPSIPHFKDRSKNGPFYLNMCVPSELEVKSTDVARYFGKDTAKDIVEYREAVADVLSRAENNPRFNKKRLRLLKLSSKIGDMFAPLLFGDWKWDTSK